MRIAALISLAVAFGSFCQAQEQTRKITVRTLCLRQAEGLKTILFQGGGKDEGLVEMPMWTNEPSEDIEISVKGDKASFFVQEKNAQGEDSLRLVAQGPVAKSSRQLFFFLPTGKKEQPYVMRSYDDDTKSFPMGSVRLINLSPTRALFKLGADPLVLKPQEAKIVPKPTKVNKFNDYTFLIQLETEEGKPYNVCQRRIKASDEKRDIAVVYLDANLEKAVANIYTDIPLWLLPGAGR